MSFNEIFDRTVRRKVSESESEFVFDESNWEKASRMIDAERGALGMAKSSKLFLLGGSVLVVIATVVLFSLGNSNDVNDKTAISENKMIVNADENINNAGKAVDNDNNINQSVSNAQTENKTVVKTDDNNLSSNFNSNTLNQSGSVSNTQTENNVEANNDNNTVSKTLSENEYNNVPESNSKVAGSLASKKINKKDANVYAGKNKKHIGNKDNTSKAAASSTLPNSNEKALVNKEENSNSSDGKNDVAVTSKPTTDHKSSTPEKKTNFTKPNSNDILWATQSVKENTQLENINYLETHQSFLPVDQQDIFDLKTTSEFIKNRDDEYYKKTRRKIHFLTAEVGTTALIGWETGNGKDAKGFNVFAGMNYGMYLSKNLSFSAGAQVYNVSNIKEVFYSNVKATAPVYSPDVNLIYNFGSSGTYTNITVNSLYYFSIPLRVSYKISNKSWLGVGLNTGFLFNGRNTIETYTETDKVKSDIVVSKKSGYYEGISKTNVLLSAFYNQSLTKRIKMNAEIIYGLSDTYINSSHTSAAEKISNTIERNVGFRLSVQYTIFDK